VEYIREIIVDGNWLRPYDLDAPYDELVDEFCEYMPFMEALQGLLRCIGRLESFQ